MGREIAIEDGAEELTGICDHLAIWYNPGQVSLLLQFDLPTHEVELTVDDIRRIMELCKKYLGVEP